MSLAERAAPTNDARTRARFFTEERDAYVLGLLRLAISTLLFLNCMRLVLELYRGGYFADFFHLPLLPESWVPNSTGYACLLSVEATAALLAGLGWWPREALLIASSIGLFLLGCDRLQYHNNRYALLLLGLLLSFTPCDRSFLVARRRRMLPLEARRAPTFARRIFQIQVTLIYASSACGKLLDADWRGGQVLLMRFASAPGFWANRGVTLPAWLVSLLTSSVFASLASKIAISTELFIAFGLWVPKTRRFALWCGVLFHFWIELSARVELFSWLMAASYLAFVVPELRERRFEFDPKRPRAVTLARALSRLDWCARFEIVEISAENAIVPNFRAIDRAGQSHTGLAAIALIAEATPLLFPFWLPLVLAARVMKSNQPRLTPESRI